MTWLAWRQHRARALLVACLLALAAAALAVQQHAFMTGAASAQWVQAGSPWVLFEILAMVLVPAALGMFIGAPLVAGELEAGTHRLAWAQSVSRRRWLLLELAFALGIGLVASAGLAALASWSIAPWIAEQQRVGNPGWFNGGTFDVVGVVPVAYTVFAVALAIAAGALTRRTLVAMFIVLVAFAAVRVTVAAAARPHYQPPVHASLSMDQTGNTLGDLYRTGAATVSMSLEDAQGRVLNGCSGTDCGRDHVVVDYQPGGRFWPFQWIEAAIYVALSALLLTVTWVVVVRRAG
jgi:hypothetical protein